MPGGRGGLDFVSFFRPGDRRFALESCSRGGDFDGKSSSLGGMVTSQIDTCNTIVVKHASVLTGVMMDFHVIYMIRMMDR